jgi:hypothetical protein
MSDGSTGTWRGRAGRIILDPEDPQGNPLRTPVDRRWLWRIEDFLTISAVNDRQRQLASDLTQYLNETCEHHWLPYAQSRREDPDTGAVDNVVPAHRQCLWCNAVEWDAEAAA